MVGGEPLLLDQMKNQTWYECSIPYTLFIQTHSVFYTDFLVLVERKEKTNQMSHPKLSSEDPRWRGLEGNNSSRSFFLKIFQMKKNRSLCFQEFRWWQVSRSRW